MIMQVVKEKAGRILAVLVLFSLFNFANAQQDCETMLQDVKNFCSKGNCEQARSMYNKLSKQCPEYASSVKGLVDNCSKKPSSSKPNTQKTSSSYPSAQQLSMDFINGSRITFPAKGDLVYDITIPCNEWFTNSVRSEWFSFSTSNNLLTVKCTPNLSPKERIDTIKIVCNSKTGAQIGSVIIRQDAGTPSSKSNAGIDSDNQTIEEQLITVKITFEKGKAKPKFDNNIGRLITALGENNNLDLQIEVYKCESQSGLKNFIKAPLIDKRFKEIMEYFGSFEIATDRISKNIIVIDGDKEGAECDCAYAKTKKKE